MNQTTNCQLPQWEATDRVTRADVNAAMRAIDTALAAAGTVKMEKIVYTGTGAYGDENPTVITFAHKPDCYFIMGEDAGYVFAMKEYPGVTSVTIINTRWVGNTVYLSSSTPQSQCNTKGRKYTAIGFYTD